MRQRSKDICFMIWATIITVLTILNWHDIQLCVVEGCSMYPTLADGAIVLVRRHVTVIKPNDIVSIQVIYDSEVEHLIKRVIIVKDDKIFVAGDNRNVSWYGWIDAAQIDGKVVAVLWRGKVWCSQQLQG